MSFKVTTVKLSIPITKLAKKHRKYKEKKRELKSNFFKDSYFSFIELLLDVLKEFSVHRPLKSSSKSNQSFTNTSCSLPKSLPLKFPIRLLFYPPFHRLYFQRNLWDELLSHFVGSSILSFDESIQPNLSWKVAICFLVVNVFRMVAIGLQQSYWIIELDQFRVRPTNFHTQNSL